MERGDEWGVRRSVREGVEKCVFLFLYCQLSIFLARNFEFTCQTFTNSRVAA